MLTELQPVDPLSSHFFILPTYRMLSNTFLLHEYCYLIIDINNDIHTTMDKGITMSSIRTDVTQLNLMERVQNSLTYCDFFNESLKPNQLLEFPVGSDKC